jgi:hypothetical protein
MGGIQVRHDQLLKPQASILVSQALPFIDWFQADLIPVARIFSYSGNIPTGLPVLAINRSWCRDLRPMDEEFG